MCYAGECVLPGVLGGDWSDNYFTINPRPPVTPTPGEQETLKLISPNGGEALRYGDLVPITWNYTGSSQIVSINLRMPGGAEDRLIANRVANNRRYFWLVPSYIPKASHYTLDITAHCATLPCSYTSGTNYDVSDGQFSIVSQ